MKIRIIPQIWFHPILKMMRCPDYSTHRSFALQSSHEYFLSHNFLIYITRLKNSEIICYPKLSNSELIQWWKLILRHYICKKNSEKIYGAAWRQPNGITIHFVKCHMCHSEMSKSLSQGNANHKIIGLSTLHGDSNSISLKSDFLLGQNHQRVIQIAFDWGPSK